MTPLDVAIDVVLRHRKGCARCLAWWAGEVADPCAEGLRLHEQVRVEVARRELQPDAARWRP